MANLTMVIDDDLLRRARIRAAEQETSVNAVLRRELQRYAVTAGPDRAAEDFLAFAGRARGDSHGARWSRDELYDERLGRR